MLTELLGNARELSSHWTIVLTVALLFLVVQLALSLRLFVKARSQHRTLRRLVRDAKRGGNGRRDPEDLPASFSWLEWVLTMFPEGSPTTPSFSREDALGELDVRMASERSYLLLQRMGIMAPLLGVVLTVIGFFWLNVDAAAEQSLQTILTSVTPLIAGVGAGAVLALINQGLLQGIGSQLERTRMAARNWFDAVIWRQVGEAVARPATEATATIDRFTQTVVHSAKRHAASSERIDAATAALQGAASQFQEVVGSFRNEIRGIPQALCELRDATAASARMLEDMLPAGQRAVANLDVSVAAFRTIIDREFSDAAKLHHRSSKLLATSVDHLQDSTDRLKAGAEQVALGAHAHSETLERIDATLAAAGNELAAASNRLRTAVESDLAPSQTAMRRTSTSFAQTAGQLAAFADSLQPALGELNALHETLSGLRSTVDSIQEFSHSRVDMDRLLEALARASEVADAIAALPEQVRDVIEQGATPHEDAGARRIWLRARPR